ncbi:MAG: divergent polysaccharide deacetylase family protein, partial [Pseudomonadota bacterium]
TRVATPVSETEAPTAPQIAQPAQILDQPAEPRRPAPVQIADAQAPSVGVGEPARRLGISEPEAEPVATEEVTPVDGRALVKNREAFEADTDLAQLAVILIHEGTSVPTESTLASLPNRVSFAVDARAANAGDIAQAYREAGREVVLIPSLPPRATPQDVEVALSANLNTIGGAVAVMDPGTAGFQSDRAAVGQVVAVVSETGHGLITAARGLNTAQQIASRFDVPSALIFNDLGAGQDAAATGRALDRMAFRARQEEGIIILGRSDAATQEGLASWLGSRAAEGLQLAPVSAVLAPMDVVPEVDSSVSETVENSPTERRLPQIRSVPDSRSN